VDDDGGWAASFVDEGTHFSFLETPRADLIHSPSCSAARKLHPADREAAEKKKKKKKNL